MKITDEMLNAALLKAVEVGLIPRSSTTTLEQLTGLRQVLQAAMDSATHQAIIEAIRQLSDEERLDAFAKFCRHCGSADPHCTCSKDE